MPSPTPMNGAAPAARLRDRRDDAALGGAVELGQHEAGQAERRVERLHLRERVLPGVRVEHQQHLVRRALLRLRDHALDLPRSRPSGAAASAAARPCRRAPRRCRAPARRRSRRTSTAAGSPLCLRDHRDVVALAPDDELLARGRAKRVAGGEQHRRPCCCSHFASLPIEVVLPAPLTPASMITNGRSRRSTSGFSSGASSVDERLASAASRGSALVARAPV